MRQLQFTDCVEIVGEACQPFSGYKQYVSTGAVAINHISNDDIELVDYDGKPSRANLIAKSGDILFAKMMGTKKTLHLDEDTAQNIYSTGFCAVRARPTVLTDRCLYHLLTSKAFLDQKDKNCSGATQKAITNAGLSKITIKVPSIGQQASIAQQLDRIASIIALRQSELQKLDELIKARFVEMFGTLEEPTHEFSWATLKELCNKITDGKHGGCTTESGTERYFVGAREIYDDEVHYETAPEINAAEFEKDYKRCNVEIGDFLIVNTGATIGKSAIASDERTTHTLLQKSVALLKVKKDVLDPIFLKWCYRVNTGIYMVKSASAQPNLLLSKINATEIYVPDIMLQKQFTDFVKQTDKSKVAVQKALDEAQLLFDSLMQKYFG
jgi:type I restriction enzyme S subunit